MSFKDTAKPWYIRKAKPTQAQFWQLFDWLRWKDEPLTIGDIDGLTEALQGKADSSVIDALPNVTDGVEEVKFYGDGIYTLKGGNLLESIILLCAPDTFVKIGSDLGADDILPETEVKTARGEVVVLNIYSPTDMTLFFSGLTNDTSIIFIKKKLK